MKNLAWFPLLFLGLLPLLGRAQKGQIFGRVVDAKTQEPIPFASIGLREEGMGGLTNEKGYFQLAGLNKVRQDSLILMPLGYRRRALLVGQGKAESLLIEMSPNPFVTRNITNGPCGIPLNSEKSSPKTSLITGLPGTQFAFFIGNEKRKQLRKMRSVSFYIGENGLPLAAFRIRIYKADGKSHSPATDLLNERVFLMVPRGGEWYTKDLSRYNIVVPEEGYFVALEFGTPATALPHPDKDNYMPSGQMMRPAFDFKKSSIWSYSQENGWDLLPQSNSSRRYNAMVKVEVGAVE